ncbi:MAG: 3-deoxy-D-manno-octulosonic acid kinase [Pseudoxanthomonas sp.]
MNGFDSSEGLTPFRDGRGYGAILFDSARFRQAEPAWMSSAYWGEHSRPVGSGGRGGACFIDAPFGPALLRPYKRGGLAAKLSHDRYLWRSAMRTRSFAEFRLTRALLDKGLPVPRPIAASYLREGLFYRAAILLDRLPDVHSFADRLQVAASDAPWEEVGRLIARFHRAGLDHADLNAHNLLFDSAGKGWLIDFDRGQLRIPATWWRERNLSRLQRSVLKLSGKRGKDEVHHDFSRLRSAYDHAWERGT